MQEKVNEYIRENKVNMLGMPLPNEEKMQVVDFDTQENFEFVFDIALAPEFKAELSEKDAIDYYTIAVSDDMINSQLLTKIKQKITINSPEKNYNLKQIVDVLDQM